MHAYAESLQYIFHIPLHVFNKYSVFLSCYLHPIGPAKVKNMKIDAEKININVMAQNESILSNNNNWYCSPWYECTSIKLMPKPTLRLNNIDKIMSVHSTWLKTNNGHYCPDAELDVDFKSFDLLQTRQRIKLRKVLMILFVIHDCFRTT